MYYQSIHEDELSPTKRNLLFAWSTHMFTASGVLWGFLAIMAIFNEDWIGFFLWMAVSVFVDAFDGLLARRARVKEFVPGFDGALLDNMVDFLNYVVVPAIFIYAYGLLPESLALLGVSLVMLSSSYQFCQSDAKTDDHYFTGFPSYWNIMAFYLFILNMAPMVNFIITIVLVVLVFVPIKYVYPTRTVRFQRLTMPLSVIWGLLCVALLLQHPNQNTGLLWLSVAFPVYYVLISLSSMSIFHKSR